jgi:GNAT superfamily N-acetyltransferase
MEYAVLGWPDEGPTLRLDYRWFSYAGKFVMSSTGKAVARDPETQSPSPSELSDAREWTDLPEPPETDDPTIVAAVAFNDDRTDDGVCWLRYVTVRRDRRGEGIGPRLVRFLCDLLHERGYDEVRIAVNNPFAFHALSRAGFGYTGDRTGIAELVMAWPAERSRESYQSGLDVYRERDLSATEKDFLDAKRDCDPPSVVSVPQ